MLISINIEYLSRDFMAQGSFEIKRALRVGVFYIEILLFFSNDKRKVVAYESI